MRHEMQISTIEVLTASMFASSHARLATTAKWFASAHGCIVNYTPAAGPGGTS